MKFATLFFFAAAFAAVSTASSAPIAFDVEPGQNPHGDGTCDGAKDEDGKPKPIPCSCPPPPEQFRKQLEENVNKNAHWYKPDGLHWPDGPDPNSQLQRLFTANDTLTESFHCPPESSTYNAQIKIAALAPDLGHSPGANPTGTGGCATAMSGEANGQPTKVPCASPAFPERVHGELVTPSVTPFAELATASAWAT
ncbi:hypothetical protein BC835DRAFT_1419705 [Cytidiella melzeri]|nr:hypothetical protein BC835DRAFT_1419705 [Cytidiella melzeri]